SIANRPNSTKLPISSSARTSARCYLPSSSTDSANRCEMYTGIHLFRRTIAFLSFPFFARCYPHAGEIRSAHKTREAKRRRWGVMASDGMGPKGPGGGLVIDRDAQAPIGDEAASVIELTGVIKWFDVSKGYGFIVPDNGMPDILLHVTCLR